MSASTARPKPTVPIALSFEAIDDLIYDARAGDLDALNTDITNLASQHNCAEAQIVASAIDMEDESEGGSGSCVLHFPAANGNIGSSLRALSAWGILLPYFESLNADRKTDSTRNPQHPASKNLVSRLRPTHGVRQPPQPLRQHTAALGRAEHAHRVRQGARRSRRGRYNQERCRS